MKKFVEAVGIMAVATVVVTSYIAVNAAIIGGVVYGIVYVAKLAWNG